MTAIRTRFFTPLLTLLILLLFALAAYSGMRVPVDFKDHPYWTKRIKLFHQAVRLDKEQRLGEKCWPGLSLDKNACMLLGGEYGTVFICSSMNYREYSEVELPNDITFEDPVFFASGDDPYAKYWGKAENNERAPLVIPADLLNPEAGDGFGKLTGTAMIYHEAFRRHQAGLGFPTEDKEVEADYPELLASNNALGNLEGLILADANTSEDPKEIKDLLRKFLAVRLTRQGELPVDVFLYERKLESHAGTGVYVELAAVEKGGFPEAKVEQFVGNYLNSLKQVNYKAEGAQRMRFYLTGGFLCRAIDKMGAKDWQKRLADKNFDITVLAQEVSGFDPEKMDELAAEAREQYGFSSIEAREIRYSTAMLAQRYDAIEEILYGKGWKLSIIFPGEELPGELDASPYDTITVDDKHRLISKFSLKDDEFEVEADGFAVIQLRPVTLTIRSQEKMSILMDGADPTNNGRFSGKIKGRLKLEAPGLSAEFDSGVVDVLGKYVTVYPLGKPPIAIDTGSDE